MVSEDSSLYVDSDLPGLFDDELPTEASLVLLTLDDAASGLSLRRLALADRLCLCESKEDSLVIVEDLRSLRILVDCRCLSESKEDLLVVDEAIFELPLRSFRA